MQEETSYDSNNRVTRIKDEKNRITRYYYDLNGNVAKKVYPNGDVITREYDALNRLVSTNTTNNGDVTLSCEYAYDAGGNLAYFTQACDGKTQALSMMYDSLNRLIYEYGCFDEYAEGQYQNDYKYKGYLLDSGWRYRGASSDFKYTYKPGTMMIDEVKNPDSSIAKFTYDSMGNITNIAVGNKRTEYKYNCYGWLTGTDEYGTPPSVYSHTGYTYDYRGRRIIKIVAATTIETSNYWYSGGVCVMEGSDKTGRRLFYRGPDMGGGVGGINYSCKADGTDLNYKHYNLRGDVIVTTDSAGAVLSQSQYEAYGEHVDFGTMPVDKHRANTKVEDAETGLLLEGRRYRSLSYKTFMSPDPLEYVDGLNFYAYCGYNPWGRWDPLGLKIDINGSESEENKKEFQRLIDLNREIKHLDERYKKLEKSKYFQTFRTPTEEERRKHNSLRDGTFEGTEDERKAALRDDYPKTVYVDAEGSKFDETNNVSGKGSSCFIIMDPNEILNFDKDGNPLPSTFKNDPDSQTPKGTLFSHHPEVISTHEAFEHGWRANFGNRHPNRLHMSSGQLWDEYKAMETERFMSDKLNLPPRYDHNPKDQAQRILNERKK